MAMETGALVTGGGDVPPIADDEYDRLYVVTLTGPGEAAVAMLRYPGCAQ